MARIRTGEGGAPPVPSSPSLESTHLEEELKQKRRQEGRARAGMHVGVIEERGRTEGGRARGSR